MLSNKWLKILLPVLLVGVLGSALILGGCSDDSNDNANDDNNDDSNPAALSGTISIGGSTTVQPLSELLAEAFKDINPQVTITVQGGGSSVGVESAANGVVDIGAASRELKSSEEGTVVPTVIARDGIAIAVNTAQDVSNLTLEQARDIFAGVITNWNEVGGADEEIVVISREEGSGTRSAFEELVMGDAIITGDALLFPSNGAVRTAVNQTPNSIAYLSFGYLDGSVTPLSIDGVAATTDNINNGTYPVVRPLLYVIEDTPEGLVKAYIDFVLSAEGQTIVDEEGYLTVS